MQRLTHTRNIDWRAKFEDNAAQRGIQSSMCCNGCTDYVCDGFLIDCVCRCSVACTCMAINKSSDCSWILVSQHDLLLL